MKKRILIVDDEPSIREFLRILLKREGYDVAYVEDAKQCLACLQKKNFHVVLTDISMANMGGMELLLEIKKIYPFMIVIMMTAYGSEELAVEAIKGGASDYLTKPFQTEKLLHVIKTSLELNSVKSENRRLRSALGTVYSFENFIGTSESMQQVFSLIKQIAVSKSNVLITGESGTGKELVAHLIHSYSDSSGEKGPFVAVNCGAFQESLLESEMFGHKKGAFTGAEFDKEGLFEKANNGTLFLDEVAELSLPIQVKLLRAIQDKAFRRVGGLEDISVNVRIIAATNVSLEEAIHKDKFRKDLYYRLDVLRISLPPLRQRIEDIPLLVKHFCKRFVTDKDKGITFSNEAMEILKNYNFPGNVRELENIIERAIAICDGEVILPENIPPRIARCATLISLDMPALAMEGDSIPMKRAGEIPEGFNLERRIEEHEKSYIKEAMKQAKGVRSKAARILGISFRSLRYRLAKFSILDDNKDYEKKRFMGF